MQRRSFAARGHSAWALSVGVPVALGMGLLAGACAPQGDPEGDDDDKAPGRTAFEWAPLAVGGVTPRWGSVAVERADDTLVLGGVSGAADEVLEDAFSARATGDALQVAADVGMDRARYCHCAMHDTVNDALVVIGGRGGDFGDADVAALVRLDNGASTVLEDDGAANFPVGCQALFFPDLGRGYVFGGLSSERGAFGGATTRYDADTQTFTALDIAGPPARYDAATHVLDDGTGLLVGGMGGTAFRQDLFADVWRFDPITETWSEIAPSTEAPLGRRYPWTAVSPDEETLLFGFGSDSGRGTSVLGDLWSFSLADGAWQALEVPDSPAARGFTYRWGGGSEEMAGVLAFGFDGQTALEDAWALLVPDAQRGRWH